MAVTQEEIANFMSSRMMEARSNPDGIDRLFRDLLGEYGFDPDHVFSFGNTIVMLAVQMEQAPEEAMVGAFVSGIIIGAGLGVKP